jgi:hypothetical protein
VPEIVALGVTIAVGGAGVVGHHHGVAGRYPMRGRGQRGVGADDQLADDQLPDTLVVVAGRYPMRGRNGGYPPRGLGAGDHQRRGVRNVLGLGAGGRRRDLGGHVDRHAITRDRYPVRGRNGGYPPRGLGAGDRDVAGRPGEARRAP